VLPAARKHGRKITLDFALPKEPRQVLFINIYDKYLRYWKNPLSFDNGEIFADVA
jgi:hypothetical protein